MEMPQPSETHRTLARLAGHWSGEERMHPSQWDPAGYVAQARHKTRVGLGEFAVLVDYEQERDDQIVFSGHGVWTVDPHDEENECVLYWFDSFGMGVETFRGGWDGDVLTVRSRNQMGQFRLTYDMAEPDTIQSRMESSPDGDAWRTMFDGTYHRKE